MNMRFLHTAPRVKVVFAAATMVILLMAGWGVSAAAPASHDVPSSSPLAHLAKGDSSQQEMLLVSGETDKTWITLPVHEKVIVSPEYEHPELRLHFTPPILPVDVAGIMEDSLVSSIEFQEQDATAGSLSIRVKEPIQFLLSRPEQNQLRVLLVPQKPRTVAAQASAPDVVTLSEIEFTQDREGRFYIKLYGDASLEYVTQPGPEDQIRILLPDLMVPSEYTKLYRLNKFDTVVQTALLENTGQGAQLNLAVDRRVPFNVEYGAQSLVFVFNSSQAGQSASAASASRGEGASVEADGPDAQEMDEFAELFPGMQQSYSGQKISIDLQNADVELVLRLIAEVSGYNLIIDDQVSGKISLKLEEVPWDQALDLVLLQKNLDKVVRGNIMRIATAEQIRAESQLLQEKRRRALEAKETMEALEPLVTEYLQINYTTASQLVPQVTPFLTPNRNGVSINSDPRTNLLIVRDTRSKIDTIRRVIQKLDRPERQVLIEARIISATDEFQKGLGLRWGGGLEHTSSGGSTVSGIRGLQGATTVPSSGSLDLSGFAVNLPNQGPTTLGIGGFISKLTGQDLFTLDAQLQLGEEKNLTRIISSPRIVTLNNQRAEIQQGTLVASQAESESGGTTTEYTEAVLKLSVLPQITPDNKLILDLEISDDSPAPTGDDISTRKARTKLIVNNEETIVLGGVHKSTERDNQDKVPGLGDVPLLGWAFKSQFDSRNQEELLVFIRPKILE